MRLFYIDESGTGLKDKASAFFVLAALGIDANDAPDMDRAVAVVKRRLITWAKPEDFEIKGRDIQRGEKLFSRLRWEQRVEAMQAIARLVADLPCKAVVVLVDKRDLPEYVGTENDLYRVAFWWLLEELEAELEATHEYGLLMMDARSDLHSSVQDRRLIDLYRDWVASRAGPTRFVEIPWFGFSAFYAGLQLVDFVAYLTDVVWHEGERGVGTSQIRDVFSLFQARTKVVRIP